MEAQTIMASGGVSGAVVAALYVFYKCCYRRKLKSKCCMGEMDIGAGEASPTVKEVSLELPKDVKGVSKEEVVEIKVEGSS